MHVVTFRRGVSAKILLPFYSTELLVFVSLIIPFLIDRINCEHGVRCYPNILLQ